MKQLTFHLIVNLISLAVTANSQLTYIGSANNAPFEYRTPTGENKGFYVDLLKELGQFSGCQINIVLGDKEALIDEAGDRTNTFFITSACHSKEGRITYSNPVAYLSYSVYCNVHDYFNQMDIFDQKTVWAESDAAVLDYIESVGGNRTRCVTNRLDTLFPYLKEGSALALFMPTLQGDYLIKQDSRNDIRKYTPSNAVFKLCLTFIDGRDDIVTCLNRGLVNLRQSGRYGEMFDRWFASGNRIDIYKLSEFKDVAITLLVILLVLSSLLWNFILRRKVRLRTEELTKAMSFQKSILKKLYFSEKKYYGLFANMSNSAFMAQVIYNINGVVDFEIKEVNKEFMALYNILPEDVIGKCITDLYDRPVFNQRLFTIFQKTQESSKPQSFEAYDSKLKKWVLVTAFQPDKDHVACIMEDVTENIMATQVIKESEKKYRELMNNASVGITLIDLHGKIQFINKRGARNFDHVPELITNKRLNQFLDPHNASYIMRQVANIVKEGMVADFEEMFVINGKEKWYLSNYQPIRSKGRITGVQVISQDITDKKNTLKELQESERRFRLYFKNAPISILILDKDMNILMANYAATELLRQNESELLETNLAYFLRSSHFIKIKSALNQISINESIRVSDLQLRTHKREVLDVLYEFVVLTSTTRICFIQDITQLKEKEGRLQKALKKAEESDNLKSAFLANMSHEVRTPMNAILGFAQLLKTKKNLTIASRDKYIDIINQRGRDLLRIINDIVDISKIQSEQLEIKPSPLSLSQLMGEVEHILKNELKDKSKEHIQLNFKYDEYKFLSDDLRLKQIITNLGTNAIKFTEQGSIDIMCRMVSEDEKDYLLFSVRDTGIGISEDKQELIFERFRQADQAHSRLFGGTGLGLAISKGLTRLLNGKIWLESSMGGPTTFFVVIPFKPVVEAFSLKS